MIRLLHLLLETARLMVGLPNYDRYCRHVRKHHPGRQAMTRTAFFRNRQRHRYAGSVGGKCC